MPQGDYIELHRKRHGFKLDHFERKRKKEARAPHKLAEFEKKVFGLKAKLHHKKRHAEKAVMRKTIAMHQQVCARPGPRLHLAGARCNCHTRRAPGTSQLTQLLWTPPAPLRRSRWVWQGLM